MKWMKFLIEYIKSPRSIGAVAPSSQKLAEKMVNSVNFENSECIVEYGAGTGVFTEKLIARKKEDTLLIVFENNREFYNILLNKYKNKKKVWIINDGAENINKYINKLGIEQVDYIVSGLPFTSLHKNISDIILNNTRDILKSDGEFITFQYSLVKNRLFKSYFKSIKITKIRLNLPPAYVLSCRA
ncbi:rRNA adenine N-6-methyltransferase family protein [Clostridium sp. YIM B02555]|uniref:class I SAM-dependent methyltransferase n=1 Tax=Clostridium sp. YIM B02555 TaxID=2911968 RepID=UPI001EEE3E89|nr:rRNA adenine N-6-methyltransferase family protein [Clostridium sp. YIM B02555]